MATYKEIQQAVKKKYGFVPETCWIAHILSDYGLTTRKAPNRIHPNRRAVPCPEEKRKPIENVMRSLGVLKR